MVKPTLSLTDSEMPRKLTAAINASRTIAAATGSTSMKTLR